jgi:hypothetical protein
MSYLFNPTKPIHATADELGQPQAFTYQNVRRKVDRVLERYRVDEGWWEIFR